MHRVPLITEIFHWGSTPPERLKTTVMTSHRIISLYCYCFAQFLNTILQGSRQTKNMKLIATRMQYCIQQLLRAEELLKAR